jgi:hypothetical protein
MFRVGAEPKRTVRKTARPAKRTCQETTRFAVAYGGRRSRPTRRQRLYGRTTGKSPSAMSTLPCGTEGFPSCPAESAGNQKLPSSTHAAGRAFTTPGPTEPYQPRSTEKHRAGPQLPRLANDPAEPVNAAPNAHDTLSTTTRRVTTRDYDYGGLAGPSGDIPARWPTMRCRSR